MALISNKHTYERITPAGKYKVPGLITYKASIKVKRQK